MYFGEKLKYANEYMLTAATSSGIAATVSTVFRRQRLLKLMVNGELHAT